jgi:hypothetical protein
MVCDKCLAKRKAKGDVGNIVPDKDRDGATNHGKASVDKRISAKQMNNPYTKRTDKPRSCGICKLDITEGHYCHDCAYKKGICSACGKKIVDTKLEYRSTNA